MTAPLTPVELSICREDDGDMNLEIYLDKHNQISISIRPDGVMNWAGMVDGVSKHAYESEGDLGKLLFTLINKGAAHD